MDCLLTGTGFSRPQLEALWTDAAAFGLDAERRSELPG